MSYEDDVKKALEAIERGSLEYDIDPAAREANATAWVLDTATAATTAREWSTICGR